MRNGVIQNSLSGKIATGGKPGAGLRSGFGEVHSTQQAKKRSSEVCGLSRPTENGWGPAKNTPAEALSAQPGIGGHLEFNGLLGSLADRPGETISRKGFSRAAERSSYT